MFIYKVVQGDIPGRALPFDDDSPFSRWFHADVGGAVFSYDMGTHLGESDCFILQNVQELYTATLGWVKAGTARFSKLKIYTK